MTYVDRIIGDYKKALKKKEQEEEAKRQKEKQRRELKDKSKEPKNMKRFTKFLDDIGLDKKQRLQLQCHLGSLV